jgi:hypothetical protein
MSNTEILRESRNLLLKLHKSLVDHDRVTYEAFNGKTTSTEFLHLLLNNPDLEWLRRFSTLIVDIDEMFAQRDGFSEEQIDSHLDRMRELMAMEGEDGFFQAKYRLALQNDLDAAALHADIKKLLQ